MRSASSELEYDTGTDYKSVGDDIRISSDKMGVV